MIAVNESGAALPLFRRGVHRVGPGDLFVLNPEEVMAADLRRIRFGATVRFIHPPH
jgi:hypothetical protein